MVSGSSALLRIPGSAVRKSSLVNFWVRGRVVVVVVSLTASV